MQRRHIVVLVIILGLISLLLVLTPHSIRYQRTEQQCRFRLRRLGFAVTMWVIEQDYQAFPPIQNPRPRTLWQPGDPESAAEVLRPYLSGDSNHFRPQRVGERRIPSRLAEDESESDYIARLRERELTVDPATGFPFWYNALELRYNDPRRMGLAGITKLVPDPELAPSGDRIALFTCQPTAEGDPPYTVDGEPGSFGVFGYTVLRQVLPEHIAEERAKIEAIEEANIGKPAEEWTHDLIHLREELGRLERALHQHPEGFVVTRLDSDVAFIPAE